MTTPLGEETSPPSNIMSEPVAQPMRGPVAHLRGGAALTDPVVSATLALHEWMAATLPLDADNITIRERLEWLITHAEALARLARSDRAAVLRDMATEAGSWRALGEQLGCSESTLRGQAKDPQP